MTGIHLWMWQRYKGKEGQGAGGPGRPISSRAAPNAIDSLGYATIVSIPSGKRHHNPNQRVRVANKLQDF